MFLPLLDASRISNGQRMIGMVVEVWTSDDQRFLYEITEVRHAPDQPDDAATADHEELWLQTSEGPAGHRPASSRSSPTLLSQEAATTRRPPEAAPGGLRLRLRSSRSAAGARRGHRGQRQHDRRDEPEPAGLAATERDPRLAHAEDAGDRADPGEDDRHAR